MAIFNWFIKYSASRYKYKGIHENKRPKQPHTAKLKNISNTDLSIL